MSCKYYPLTAVLLILAAPAVQSRSTGAPAEACFTLTPQHTGTTAQTSQSPYELDVDMFEDVRPDQADPTYSYSPSTTYNCECRNCFLLSLYLATLFSCQ